MRYEYDDRVDFARSAAIMAIVTMAVIIMLIIKLVFVTHELNEARREVIELKKG